MYCTYCGHENTDEAKFCVSCGKSLQVKPPQVQPISRPEPQSGKSSNWLRRLPSIGGLIVLVCFFLPWIMASCTVYSEAGIEVTGFELATGNYGFSLGDFGDYSELETSSSPLFFLIPIFGLLGLLSLNGRLSGLIFAIIFGILGVLGLVIFLIVLTAMANEISPAFKISYRIGYWGSWLGFLWQIITGFATIGSKG